MDLLSLDTRPAAERGAVLHLKHPVFGHRLYEGEGADQHGRLRDPEVEHEPVTITVRGEHSESVRAVRRDAERARMAGEDLPEERLARDLADAMVVEWSGVTDEHGKPLPCTRDNKYRVLDANHRIWDQVRQFAADQANFFTAA